jgi:hypothetical protein
MMKPGKPFAAAAAAALALAGVAFARSTNNGAPSRGSVDPPAPCHDLRCLDSNGNHFGWVGNPGHDNGH